MIWRALLWVWRSLLCLAFHRRYREKVSHYTEVRGWRARTHCAECERQERDRQWWNELTGGKAGHGR